MTEQADAIEKVTNAKDKPDGEPNDVTVSQSSIQREIDKNKPDLPGPEPRTTDVSKR
jgi:hypothetical protein